MIVMKFGGTSVGSGERLSHVAALVAAQPGPVAVIVSARLRDLTHFHDTVTHSLSWKVLQRLRGFVGRAW